jgi:hypothetical protein
MGRLLQTYVALDRLGCSTRVLDFFVVASEASAAVSSWSESHANFLRASGFVDWR